MKAQYPKKEAVALRYDKQRAKAPLVTGKGKGFVADEIIKRAIANDVPIQADPSLVELLGQLEIDQTIPTELFEVVAEVFAFIYQVEKHHVDWSKEDRAGSGQ